MYKTLIKPFFEDVKTFVLDTLFPISCLSCGKEGAFICLFCKTSLTKAEPCCIICRKPSPFGFTHTSCQTPQGADGLISFFDYHDERVAKIIITAKYSFIPSVYGTLGTNLAEKIKTLYPNLSLEDFLLVPIPLHATRKRWRGFNQAEILCESMSKYLNWPVADVLKRTKITRTQKNLKKEQRTKNIEKAFELRADTDIHGKNIILVDDVTTTGATLLEGTKVLKRNGASKVICLTIARD
jgi:competence protein ComFC